MSRQVVSLLDERDGRMVVMARGHELHDRVEDEERQGAVVDPGVIAHGLDVLEEEPRALPF